MTIDTICTETVNGLTTDGRLMAAARRRHGRIHPCAGKTWAECFTVEAGQTLFWYNDASGSTHVIFENKLMPQWKYNLLRGYLRRA